jgi:hypothetical protein
MRTVTGDCCRSGAVLRPLTATFVLEKQIFTQNEGPFLKIPLIVMTDQFSASASEVTAGVLQSYGRGIILGDRTFGKGTVYVVHEFLLPGVTGIEINVTEFVSVLPSGRSAAVSGVTPDFLQYAFPSPFVPHGHYRYENFYYWKNSPFVPKSWASPQTKWIAQLAECQKKQGKALARFRPLVAKGEWDYQRLSAEEIADCMKTIPYDPSVYENLSHTFN